VGEIVGLVGPPPRESGTTRLYLAGPRAGEAAGLFEGTALEAVVMPGAVGTASALKMAYAAWTKGSGALLLAVGALAIHEDVDGALRAKWERSQPGLGGRSEAAVGANAREAWRLVGEMEEIAATFAAAGLPAGFHEACAAIYGQIGRYKEASATPSIAEVAAALAGPPATFRVASTVSGVLALALVLLPVSEGLAAAPASATPVSVSVTCSGLENTPLLPLGPSKTFDLTDYVFSGYSSLTGATIGHLVGDVLHVDFAINSVGDQTATHTFGTPFRLTEPTAISVSAALPASDF